MFDTEIPEWRDLIKSSDHYVVSSGSPYLDEELICCRVKAISSVELLSHIWRFAIPWTVWHAMLLCPIPTPRAYSNSYPSSWWCRSTTSSSVIPFSSCLQSFPASGSFLMSQFFSSGGQSIGVSASASVFLLHIQDWFPLGLTDWISLQSKGPSRVFSNITV